VKCHKYIEELGEEWISRVAKVRPYHIGRKIIGIIDKQINS
jgi:hypothetical protein